MRLKSWNKSRDNTEWNKWRSVRRTQRKAHSPVSSAWAARDTWSMRVSTSASSVLVCRRAKGVLRRTFTNSTNLWWGLRHTPTGCQRWEGRLCSTTRSTRSWWRSWKKGSYSRKTTSCFWRSTRRTRTCRSTPTWPNPTSRLSGRTCRTAPSVYFARTKLISATKASSCPASTLSITRALRTSSDSTRTAVLPARRLSWRATPSGSTKRKRKGRKRTLSPRSSPTKRRSKGLSRK